MNLTGNWNYPTSVRFGPGRIRELPELCRANGLNRPLLVTDPGLSGLAMVADALAALPPLPPADLEAMAAASAQDALLVLYLSKLLEAQVALADRLGTASLPIL